MKETELVGKEISMPVFVFDIVAYIEKPKGSIKL